MPLNPALFLAEKRVGACHGLGVGVRFDDLDVLDVRMQIEEVAAVTHGAQSFGLCRRECARALVGMGRPCLSAADAPKRRVSAIIRG